MIPAHASVLVIGGGVMGCSTLYHLAKEGVTDAVLLERNRLTSGTTWHSAAQVRALRSGKNLTDLIRESIALYSRLPAETGQSVGWINQGSLSVAATPARLTHIRRQESLARLFGLRAQFVAAGEAKERWPLMNADDIIGAVWSPDDGRVNPSDLCAALVKGAKSAGARVLEHTAVDGIETKNGRLTGVRTAAGVIRCDAVALCAGLWSRDIAQTVAAAPLWPCEHFYLLTQPLAGVSGPLPTLSDHDSHLYVRDEGGGLLVGFFEPHGKAISPDRLGKEFSFQLLPEDWAHVEPMMKNALHRVPALANAAVKMLLNGPESFTPDGMFLLGETAETRGLFLGCGMNSIGIAAAGGAGRALAFRILHGRTPNALPEADPKRFPACYNSAAALAARVPEVLGEHYVVSHPGRHPRTARDLRRLPLHEHWRRHKAHFGQFYGWERPLYFNKRDEPELTFARPDWFLPVGEEVRHAHEKAAIFDLSSLGKIAVRGRAAEDFLNRVCANNMAKPPGRVIYTAMLNEDGGMESDLTAQRLDDDDYRLYTGTDAIGRDLAWLKNRRRPGERVELADETEAWAVLALCGDRAPPLVAELGAEAFNRLPYFGHGPATLGGCPVHAARLSYVGEAGWEITCAARDANSVYEALHRGGARPAGLFAQSAMRIEKRFLAYGRDLDADITPLEAGLEFAVDWRTPFIGREALRARKQNGTTTKIAAIVLGDAAANPLGGEPVWGGDAVIGRTTSAAFGYRLQAPVALALVQSEEVAGPVKIDIAGELFGGEMMDGAAYDPAATRMKVSA